MTKQNKIILLIVITIIGIVAGVRNYEYQNALVELPDRLEWLKTDQTIKRKVYTPLEGMIMSAEKSGLCLVVSSGNRTRLEQEKIKAKYGDLAANPGDSEHETGLAVDLQACPMTNGKRDDAAERPELAKPFDELPEYRWLRENAVNFGFSQTYSNEPWHWKFK